MTINQYQLVATQQGFTGQAGLLVAFVATG
jgi:hypothetical protein